MKRAFFVTLLGSLTLATWSSDVSAQDVREQGWIRGSNGNSVVPITNNWGGNQGLNGDNMQSLAWIPIVGGNGELDADVSIQHSDYKAGTDLTRHRADTDRVNERTDHGNHTFADRLVGAGS